MDQGSQQGQQLLRPLPLIPQLLWLPTPISCTFPFTSTSHPLIHPLVLLLDLRAFSHYLSGLLALAHPCLSPNTPL